MILTDTKQPLPANSYNLLTHIDDVSPYSDRDEKILLALGEILISYGAHEKFGISLLHKHYDLNNSEIILEMKSQVDKEFNISVQQQVDMGEVSPCMWVFVRSNDAIRATQWFTKQESCNMSPITDNDLSMLISLRNKMIEFNCIERFGISLLHRVRVLNKNEILMENTDEEARIQEMKLTPDSFIDEQDNIQTLWSFERNGKNKINSVCKLECSWSVGHRQRHTRTGRPT